MRAVERFSPIALGCVGVILLTGTYQAWRGVGTWPALVDTTYGRLLLIKIGAMCVLIGLGYVARIRIAALRASESEMPVRAAEFVAAGLPKMRALVGARAGHGLLGTAGRLHNGGGNGTASNGTANGGASNGNGSNGVPHGAASNGASNGAGTNGSSAGADRAAVTLGRLRWSVAAEAMIAVAVLGITSILVNTATARETFTPPVSATAVSTRAARAGAAT